MLMITTQRLTAGDMILARTMFRMMADVFEEPCDDLSDAYLERWLGRPDFWGLVALLDGQVVGGLTAYALELTRLEKTELFIYDLAVRQDMQRKGIGRQLITTLYAQAQAQGIQVMFVPADNEDVHALDFYRAMGGEAAAVTIFTFA